MGVTPVLDVDRAVLLPGCGPACGTCRGRGSVRLFLTVEDPCRACGGSGGPRWRRPPVDVLGYGSHHARAAAGPGVTAAVLVHLAAWEPGGLPDLRRAFAGAGGSEVAGLSLVLRLEPTVSLDAWLGGRAEWTPGRAPVDALRSGREPLTHPDDYQSVVLQVVSHEGDARPALETARLLAREFGPVGLSLLCDVGDY